MSNWRAEIQNAELQQSLNVNARYHGSSWVNRTQQLSLVQVMCLSTGVHTHCVSYPGCLSAASLLKELLSSSIEVVSKLPFLG